MDGIRIKHLPQLGMIAFGHGTILKDGPNIPVYVDYTIFDRRYHTLIPERDCWFEAITGTEGYVNFYTDDYERSKLKKPS